MLAPLQDARRAARAVYDSVAGFGPLQRRRDDSAVEEIWINEPGRVFVARQGRSELTTTILTPLCATLSHMEIGVRELRNRTGQVIDAVRAGERVTLTVHGEPVADIVAHGRRSRWLTGAQLREQLQTRAADPGLTSELDELAGQTLDEL